ncbi:DUF559 domain-containing protein [Microbacterium indicum]|uniref:DUF559 domain-containing protein n=1 Tax=Microbacterium indicum TaxID=358100 RepID=UPI000408415D|nr:DUF559 domain-containing protein [Microbacterium indicum]
MESSLGPAFLVRDALASGMTRGQLRRPRWDHPFHSIRAEPDLLAESGREERIRGLARAFAPRLGTGHVFSHETAAVLYGAPVPVGDERIHVSALGDAAFPRSRGVRAHRERSPLARVAEVDGLPVASPPTTWAQLGHLPVDDIVAVGDFLCRVWRVGVGRPDPGRPPLATIDELRAAASGRRVGASDLRAALEWIRRDSWSPRESKLRCAILRAGLPEPDLNVDVRDASSRFLGCVDMAYRRLRIAVEYQGAMHAETYAQDIERIERLRAAGWIVLQVTKDLLARPPELRARIAAALRARGALIR